MNEGVRMKRHWETVLGRPRPYVDRQDPPGQNSPRRGHEVRQWVFPVREEHVGSVQQTVISSCRRPRRGSWPFWFILPLLDGSLDNLPGPFGSGEWSVRGLRLARWVLYRTGCCQPERFRFEVRVPTQAELDMEILLMEWRSY